MFTHRLPSSASDWSVSLTSTDVPAAQSHLAPVACSCATRFEKVYHPAQGHSGSGNLSHRGNMTEAKAKTSPKAIKFLFGGLAGYVMR